MTTPRYQTEIGTAIESTKDLPEPFKTEAFKIVLTHLLQTGGERESGRKPSATIKTKTQLERGIESEVELDFSKIESHGDFHDWNWHDRLVYLLQWAGENHPEKGLTTGEIAKILRERFGFHTIQPKAVASRLKENLIKSRYATRKAISARSYRWFISPPGQKYVKKLIAEASEDSR